MFTGTPGELFGDQEALQTTGLRAPIAAALAARLRVQYPDFPMLFTVAGWSEALGIQMSQKEHFAVNMSDVSLESV